METIKTVLAVLVVILFAVGFSWYGATDQRRTFEGYFLVTFPKTEADRDAVRQTVMRQLCQYRDQIEIRTLQIDAINEKAKQLTFSDPGDIPKYDELAKKRSPLEREKEQLEGEFDPRCYSAKTAGLEREAIACGCR